jgi:hypothetical protein
MTTPVRPSVVKRLNGSPRARGIVGFRIILGGLAVLLTASIVEGQTGQVRRAPNAQRRPAAANTATLASYVSNYTGDTASNAAPQSAPAAPTLAPTPAPASRTVSSWPAVGYEQGGAGVPVGEIPGAAFSAGGCSTCGPADDFCDGGVCWGAGSCYGGDCYPLLRPLRDRVWFEGEYLLWWLKGYGVPPLVTTSTNPDHEGILSQSTSHVLFGDQNLNNESRSGGRFTLGWWIDPCQTAGLEVRYTMLGEDSMRYESGIISDWLLARPFFDSGDGRDSSWVVGEDGRYQGWVNVRAKTEFHALEILLRRPFYQECDHRMDVLVGYRYNKLGDELSISDHRMRTSSGDPYEPMGTQIDQFDWFDTDNTFHGFELGFVNEVRYNRWSMELLTKLALGSTRSKVVIDGHTTMVYNSTPTVTPAGLLTQATNMGQYQHDSFTVIPELGLTLGYDLTSRLRFTVGYSLIYWSKIVRAGDQIDYNVNIPLVNGQRPDGAQQPACLFKTTDFWAQGMNFGFDYRF